MGIRKGCVRLVGENMWIFDCMRLYKVYISLRKLMGEENLGIGIKFLRVLLVLGLFYI